jgi:hypothetical protein
MRSPIFKVSKGEFMLKVEPDFTVTGSKEEIENTMGSSFKLNGPGWYITKTDTILALADYDLEPQERPTYTLHKVLLFPASSTWNQRVPDTAVWTIYVYNVPFGETIFSQIATAPTRKDDR